MGLLDYYRQFDDMSEGEISARLMEKRDAERAKALAHIPTIDLSGTEWPEFPNSEVMNASMSLPFAANVDSCGQVMTLVLTLTVPELTKNVAAAPCGFSACW